MRYGYAADMYRHSQRAVAFLAGLLLACSAHAQVSPLLSWTPPTTNTDGTALTLAGYVVYHGTSPATFPDRRTLSNSTAPTSYRWEDLPAGIPHYFVITAVDTASAESAPSNVATYAGPVIPPPPLQPPGAVTNLVVVNHPPGNVRVTISQINANVEFSLLIEGQGAVQISLLGSLVFDWCRPGPSGTPNTPTLPPLGGNADNVAWKSVTFTAPVTTRCDADPTTAFGGTVTVQGVTKPLVNAAGVWSASFP